MALDDDSASKVLRFAPGEVLEPRRPGRPKGSPKVAGSGRKKGRGNKTTAELREMILKRGRPIELLAAIAAGRRVKTGFKTYEYPDLQQRAAAAKILFDKLLPPPRPVELDADGDPVHAVARSFGSHEDQLDALDDGPPATVTHAELARRIVWGLSQVADGPDQRPTSPATAPEGAPETPTDASTDSRGEEGAPENGGAPAPPPVPQKQSTRFDLGRSLWLDGSAKPSAATGTAYERERDAAANAKISNGMDAMRRGARNPSRTERGDYDPTTDW